MTTGDLQELSAMQSGLEKSIPATLIPGDGIGPEIVDSTVKVLDALGAPFSWEVHPAGMSGIDAFGDQLPSHDDRDQQTSGTVPVVFVLVRMRNAVPSISPSRTSRIAMPRC